MHFEFMVSIKRIFTCSLWILFLTTSFSGCALHYYEEKTGVEHIWGIGHMKMKAAKPNEGLQAVVHGTNVLGISVGKADKHGYLTFGWQRLEFIDVLKESTSIRLDWPDNSFANVRVGSEFPIEIPWMKNTQSKLSKKSETQKGETKDD